MTGKDGEQILRQLDEREREFREKQMELMRDDDHLGAAYVSGKIFALLDAKDIVEETMEDEDEQR